MKRLLIVLVILGFTFLQQLFAQDSTAQSHSLSQILNVYFNLKDALVAGNSGSASSHAGVFIKTLADIDSKEFSEDTRSALLKDADHISKMKDIKRQREHFASLSDNMYTLMKARNVTGQTIYYAYCPMKKSHWLTNTAEIKNPYYGSAMLTCGKIEQTLN
jgi:hypothetical protein